MTDEQRLTIFTVHPTYRLSVEKELEVLVRGNWADWMVTRPD